jgi:hypothetical protein
VVGDFSRYGYGYEEVLPDGYVPIAIPIQECGSPRSINRERGRAESFTSPLSVCCPCLSLSFLGCAPPCLRQSSLRSRAAVSLASPLACNGSTSANHSARPLFLAPFDDDTICSARAGQWRPAGAEHGRGAPRRGSFRRRRTGSPTRHMATLSATLGTTSAAPPRR